MVRAAAICGPDRTRTRRPRPVGRYASGRPVSAVEDAATDAGLLFTGPPPGKPLLRGWLHLGSAVAMLGLGPWLVLRARGTTETVELSVYAISLFLMFATSALYHRVNWAPPARRVLKRLDHSTIFLAIAGSYTAIGGLSLHGWALALVLSLVWVGAVSGVVVRQCWLDAPSWAVGLPYVVTGWCAVAVLPQLERGLGVAAFSLVLAGGLFYTLGAITYARRRPNPWPRVFGFHEVFHACTILGAAAQFAAVAAFAVSRG